MHPLDIIPVATTNAHTVPGNKELAMGIRKGSPADLEIIDGNPLDDFKVMYGTGVSRYSEDGKTVSQSGGVK